MNKLLLLSAISAVTSLSAPAQDMVVRLRMAPTDTAILAFSTGRGPAIRFPGVLGALRLDLNHLILVPAVAPNQFGFSVNRFPGAGALPPDLVLCQSVIASGSAARILPVVQPLVDELVAARERGLAPLGTAGPQGAFLFGLTRDELVGLARAYAPGPIQEPLLLEEMRRPFTRANNPEVAGEIGLSNLLTLMYQEWSAMRQGASATAIRAQQQTLMVELANQWFSTRYPNGVPEDDEHWDLAVFGGPGAACYDEIVVQSSSRRLKLWSRLYRSYVSGTYWIMGTGTARAYVNSFGLWLPATPDFLFVSGTASSSGNSSSLFDSCSDCGYAYDGSPWVQCTTGNPPPRVDTYAYARWDNVVTLTVSGCDTTY